MERNVTQKNNDIYRGVVNILIDLGINENDIKPESRLMEDLHLSGDDISFVYVNNIHKLYEIELPFKDWESVVTVQDTVDILRKASIDG